LLERELRVGTLGETKLLDKILVFVYLLAIVIANLVAANFGPNASILSAFLFIGLDFTTRDFLHQKWEGNNLRLKMLALIVTGSVISYLINRNAGQIAIASMIAFAAAAVADTVVYAALGHRSWLVKVNGSNVVSSAVDSIIFPTIAFGGFLPLIVLGQFVTKVFGGFLWGFIIKNVMARYTKQSRDSGTYEYRPNRANDIVG
jgi:uncharacterized PurR-regulated membrane protein YhhQ (DUF165 family)